MDMTNMALEPVHNDDTITNISLTNVEKEELLGEEEEDEHSTTVGSVITGGDLTYNSGDDDNINGDRAVEKLELPKEFRNRVMVLTGESSYIDGCCDVYLVGTCHVSRAVFVELCPSRMKSMLYSQIVPEEPPVELEKMSVIDRYRLYKNMRKKNFSILEILFAWVTLKISSKLDVVPCDEFRVAYEEAQKCGALCIPGDRPMERAWRKMSLWEKIKLVSSEVLDAGSPLPEREELEKLYNDVDKQPLMAQLEELCKEIPSLEDTLVHERDLYMANLLRAMACHYNSVVAVVGIAHLQGIKKNWGQRPTATFKELEELPIVESTSTVKKIMYLGIVVVGIAIVSGIYLSF